MVDLSSARAKLGRAKLYTQEAAAIVKGLMGPDFYEAATEKDSKGRFIIKVVRLKGFPDEFSLTIGDAFHNLRCALDHIAYACAQKPLTSDEERRIQFLITSKRSEWLNRWKRSLPNVPAKARALINRFQPYHRRKHPENRLLGQLQAVDNWDKHRRLSVTATHVKRCELQLNVLSGDVLMTRQVLFSGRMKVGTVLSRFDLANVTDDAGVQVHGKIVVIPVFGTGMPKEVFGLSVMNRVLKIGRFIEGTVIPSFEAL